MVAQISWPTELGGSVDSKGTVEAAFLDFSTERWYYQICFLRRIDRIV